jgi:hypothetical protein
MSVKTINGENIAFHTEADHGELSCSERTSDWEAMTGLKINPRMAGNPDEQLDHAVEELISGDADDPPLSAEAVVEMVDDSQAQDGFPG